METRHIIAAVLLVSLLNGLFSPFAKISWSLMPFLFPILTETNEAMVVMAGVLALAFATLIASGVPAALYERIAGTGTTRISAWIWLAGALFLSLPMILAFVISLSRS
ncbi:MAG TPA: hypothetical protein VED46_03390 [Alphaproteobacteria bacterium]|nr:hypothetical protein [Alphaproteobacteria bacterium]